MRKLEDIPKKTPFKVPDGYFDQLPTVIQARMAHEVRRSPTSQIVSFSLKFALPVVALLVFGIFLFRPASPVQNDLQDVDTEQIALYLQDGEHLDLEESGDHGDWTKQELDQLEDAIYSNMNEEIIDDIDLDNL
ncbi:MAG TPA: hypothetical protein VF473_03710 [Cyclobacteriaceae bacterium]